VACLLLDEESVEAVLDTGMSIVRFVRNRPFGDS
jgi:hypothetical protein